MRHSPQSTSGSPLTPSAGRTFASSSSSGSSNSRGHPPSRHPFDNRTPFNQNGGSGGYHRSYSSPQMQHAANERQSRFDQDLRYDSNSQSSGRATTTKDRAYARDVNERSRDRADQSRDRDDRYRDRSSVRSYGNGSGGGGGASRESRRDHGNAYDSRRQNANSHHQGRGYGGRNEHQSSYRSDNRSGYR